MNLQQTIESKIRSSLSPLHLEVVDESHMHNVPVGSESHFRLLIVSERFEGAPLVERHQAVYRALSEEMAQQIHALGLQTLTPDEWSNENTLRAESPPCLGGGK